MLVGVDLRDSTIELKKQQIEIAFDNDSHLTWCIQHTDQAFEPTFAYHLDIDKQKMLSTTNTSATPSIVCGPSGRAIAEAIETDLLSAIQAHLNMERQAHASYFAAAIWFAERELRGFSRFFRD